jgi:peptidoglycan/xylan/chitin deacetylase (PgdA/CDA1 family)
MVMIARNASLLAALCTAAAACQATDLPKACPGGPGLAEAPLTGADLPAKTLALTFEGGPTDATLAISEYLFGRGLQAAFFVTGEQADGRKDVLSSLRRRAHVVGNFGYSGEPLTESETQVLEVRRTDEIIAPHVIGGMFLLRAPDGAFDAKLAKRLNAAGFGRYVGPVQWDVGERGGGFVDTAACWEEARTVEDCAQGYLDEIRRVGHGIVRLEATRGETESLLRVVVPKLEGEGYSFVRIDAVPLIQTALQLRGGQPGAGADVGACDEY